MVAVGSMGPFLGGVVLGALVGIFLGPLIRYWITWREWLDASREARLTEDVLKLMDTGPWRLLRDRKAADAILAEKRRREQGWPRPS
jgi:hypothetical protein